MINVPYLYSIIDYSSYHFNPKLFVCVSVCAYCNPYELKLHPCIVQRVQQADPATVPYRTAVFYCTDVITISTPSGGPYDIYPMLQPTKYGTRSSAKYSTVG